MILKRSRQVFLIAFLAFAVGLASVPVRAADNTTNTAGAALSDDQVDAIKQNCKQAQSILQRLQATDVATRVNRGRIYENLLNRLISPFNSRVSLNRYDASSIDTTTTVINQKFTDFKNDYVTYSDSFSNLLSNNCEADPRGFYTLLTTTRAGREKVADDIASLNTLFDTYTTEFGMLRSSIEGQQ